MTAAQKWIAALGILAVVMTMLFSPYRYRDHNERERQTGGHGDERIGVVHAPLWSRPTQSAWPVERGVSGARLDDIRLDVGRLALWWFGILIACAVAVILSAPRQTRARP